MCGLAKNNITWCPGLGKAMDVEVVNFQGMKNFKPSQMKGIQSLEN
jgi:hypothetical protein